MFILYWAHLPFAVAGRRFIRPFCPGNTPLVGRAPKVFAAERAFALPAGKRFAFVFRLWVIARDLLLFRFFLDGIFYGIAYHANFAWL